MQEIIETPNSVAFACLLSSPATTDQLQLELSEVSSVGSRGASIQVNTVPGKLLAVIEKDKLAQLMRGNNYSIMVRKA